MTRDRYPREIEQAVLADRHPLAGIPVEPWMFKRARTQAELLMQIAMKPTNTEREKAA